MILFIHTHEVGCTTTILGAVPHRHCGDPEPRSGAQVLELNNYFILYPLLPLFQEGALANRGLPIGEADRWWGDLNPGPSRPKAIMLYV